MDDHSCAAGNMPKHRACDECRFRKIACSKEPGGCARCEKEGIQCHYSPQKPMGRPRKRRLVDLEDSQRPVAVDVTDYVTAAAAAAAAAEATATSASVAHGGSINGLDIDYEYLAAASADDGFDASGLCGTMGPESSRQLFEMYDWNATNGGISFIDLLPDFPPESPDLFGQGDNSALTFMPGPNSGSTTLGQQTSFDGLPSLSEPHQNTSNCSGSMGFSNDENNSHSHHSSDSDLSHPSQTVSTPPSHEQHPVFHNHMVTTPPYHDHSQTYNQNQGRIHDHSYHGHSINVNTPPHTACSSPCQGAPSARRSCASALDSSSSPSCRNRCQVRSNCQDRSQHTPAGLSAAPHFHPTPLSTPHSYADSCCQSPSPSHSHSHSVSHSHCQPQPKGSGIPCTCLSSLYFALNSLVQLPTHIPSAIRTARHASRMAYQVINCRECYDVTIVDPSKQPPIQCFQNLMCLGSLVPAACNAYVSILKMVDAETDRARAEKRKLWFSLGELGGAWIAALLPCHADFLHKCNDKYIPPDVWRTAIRRILRLDVHGAEGGAFAAASSSLPPPPSSSSSAAAAAASMATPQSAALSPCSPSDAGVAGAGEIEAQQPLKGVITLLDEKNRRRHAQIDHLITTGRMPENSPYLLFPGGHKVVPPEARNCSHVLETARLALSNLSIA